MARAGTPSNDHTALLIPLNKRHVRPWYQTPVLALLLLGSLTLYPGELLIYYAIPLGPPWDSIGNNWTSLRHPIGIAAALLCVLVVLVAAGEGHAQKGARWHCPPHRVILLIHVANIALLASVLPAWLFPRSTESNGAVSNLFGRLGYVSGIGCKIMTGLCLLPTARQSVWLSAASAGFSETISFHRVTGWWCIAHVMIHTIAYTAEVAVLAMRDFSSRQYGPQVADEFTGTAWQAAYKEVEVFLFPWITRLNPETGVPEANIMALANFPGLVGALAAITLGLFGLSYIRRARYDLFYLIHIPAASLFVLMAAFHDWPMQTFAVPGLVSYCLDRARAKSSRNRTRARVRVMTAEMVRLDVFDSVDGLASEGAWGTQWAYLRVPSISNEWHAFSLADRCPSFLIKAKGDWTKQLHQLAMSRAVQALTENGAACTPSRATVEQCSGVESELVVEVDGVYGNPSPAWCSYSDVLLIGGGAGIAPWLPLMEARDENLAEQNMQMVWIARDETELQALAPYLPTTETRVFLTRVPDSACEDAVHNHDRPDMLSRGAKRAVVPPPAWRSESRRWLFAAVAVTCLCVTQLAFYYARGHGSRYHANQTEGRPPAELEFLGATALAVVGSFAGIAATTSLACWLTNRMGWMGPPPASTTADVSLSAPEQGREATGGDPHCSVLYQRPDISRLIEAEADKVEEAGPGGSSTVVAGLFVCVCGPAALVQATKLAVSAAQRRHSGIAIGLHAEESEW